MIESLPEPGESCRGRWLIRSAGLERLRRGWLWRAQGVCPAGAFEAVAFEGARVLQDVVRPPQIVTATLLGSSRGWHIEDLDPYPLEPGDAWDYLPRGPLDENEAWQRLEEILTVSVVDPDLARLRDQLLGDHDFCFRFSRAPAALIVHHPWRGGLLAHTLSLLQAGLPLAGHYGADPSMVVMGLWLHDVGKLWEIDPVAGSYTRAGELIGHLVQGVSWLSAQLQKLEDFPATTATELLHCLVAHHGDAERGSPRPPMSAAALLVHTLDRLDSEMFQIHSGEALVTPDAFAPRNPWLGRKIYRPAAG